MADHPEATAMTAGRVSSNGVELAYETFGDRQDPALLLVMGLGTQLLGWPEGLCRALAAQHFFVVRFDNRDIGLSTHLTELPAPDAVSVTLHRRRPAYRLEDLATDTIGLIEQLEIGPVHLVGASMGGFIAQHIALRRPELLASLTLMMTSTGSVRVGRTTPRVLAAVLRTRPVTDRADAVARTMATFRLIGSPAYPADEGELRRYAEESHDRAYDPAGALRQLGAVAAQRDRTEALRRLTVPTVVLHGWQDPLVMPSGGVALGRTIPGARFVGFQGMGHDLPEALWPDFVDEIARVSRRTAR